MKDLFICITPLEILIAEKIIKYKKLSKKKCKVIYFVDKINKRNNYYLKRIKKISSNSKFFVLNKFRYPFFFFKINNLVKNNKIKDIYLAAIDSSLIQFVLSKNKYQHIYTFDDGIGNLTKKYNMDFQLPLIKKLLYWLVGNRYNKESILSKSTDHFTIYKNKKNNFSKNPVYVGQLFDNIKFSGKNNCSLILGPVFKDLFNASETSKFKYIRSKYKLFLSRIAKKEKIYVMNHPREMDFKYDFKNVINIKSKYLAEDYIHKVLSKNYKSVNLYSFPVSTVTINLKNIRYVKNYLFFSKKNSARSLESIKVVKKMNLNYKYVNLDEIK